jgi:hypothetical protein
MLAIGPKIRMGDGFLRAIKILRTSSFGGEVKMWAPCFKKNVEDPFEV